MGPENAATFYAGQPAASPATVATVPTSPEQDWIVDNVILTNTTGSAALVQLNLVPVGGSAGVANELLSASYSVAANSVVSLAGAGRLGIVLQPGATLYTGQTTAAAVTMRVTGRTRAH
jgi:hypothetical protein